MASWLDQFWKNLFSNPFALLNGGRSVTNAIDKTQNDIDVGKILEGATGDPTGALGNVAKDNLTLTPEQEKYLDSLIENQKTQADNEFQRSMRDSAYTSAASQLESLGLSASGVLQSGGASSGVSSAAAGHPTTNIALQRYNQNMAIAKSILGMTSQMASAGIYGSAINAARKASSVITSQASNSALKALKTSEKKMSKAEMNRIWKKALEMESPTAYEGFDGFPF